MILNKESIIYGCSYSYKFLNCHKFLILCIYIYCSFISFLYFPVKYIYIYSVKYLHFVKINVVHLFASLCVCVSSRLITGLHSEFLMPLWVSRSMLRMQTHYLTNVQSQKTSNRSFSRNERSWYESVVNASRSFSHEHHSEFRWDMSSSASKLSPKCPLSSVARFVCSTMLLFSGSPSFGTCICAGKSTFQVFRWLAKRAKIKTRVRFDFRNQSSD